jgi:FkbM family methyltransferase
VHGHPRFYAAHAYESPEPDTASRSHVSSGRADHSRQEWEKRQIERLFSYIEAFRGFSGKRYFLDVGAYWGLYSLIAHQKRWFDYIVAFEPDPFNRSQRHAQLALNLLFNEIEVRSAALPDRTDLEPFLKSESHSTGNRGGVGLFPESDGSKTISVPTDRLDNQLQIEDAVLLIKIDVEGHEVNVLERIPVTCEHSLHCGRNFCIPVG